MLNFYPCRTGLTIKGIMLSLLITNNMHVLFINNEKRVSLKDQILVTKKKFLQQKK